MTTLDPGASDVLTHGLAVSPRSTAFLASRAAATITEGLEGLVQGGIGALATCPWSSSVCVPSASVSGTLRLGRPSVSGSSVAGWGASLCACPALCRWYAGGSLAGKDSLLASSTSLSVPSST